MSARTPGPVSRKSVGVSRYTPYSSRRGGRSSYAGGSHGGTTVSALPTSVRNALSAGGKHPAGEVDEVSGLSLVTCGSSQGYPQTYASVWKHRSEEIAPPVHTVSFPVGSDHQLYVQAVQLTDGGVSVLGCYENGELLCWPDAGKESQSSKVTLELKDLSEGDIEVTAFTAMATPAIRSSCAVSVAGCHDGTIVRVESDRRGVTLTHHFDRTPPSEGYAGGLSGILRTPGKVIGSLLRSPGTLLRAGAGVGSDPVHSLVWSPQAESRARPHLLALTASGVECWEVELVAGGSERLLWSHRLMSAMLGRLPSADVTLVDVAAVGRELYLLTACGSGAGQLSYHVHGLAVSTSDFDVLWTEPVAEGVGGAAAKHPRGCGLAAAAGRVCVVLPDGSARVLSGLGGGGAAAQRASLDALDGPLGKALSVAACEDGWVFLGDVKGVVVLSDEDIAEIAEGAAAAGTPSGASRPPTSEAGTPGGPNPAAAAGAGGGAWGGAAGGGAAGGGGGGGGGGGARGMDRDDAMAGELRAAFETFVSGGATGHFAEGLRAAAAGDSGVGRASVFGSQSRQVLDTLAKHWGQGVAAVAVDQQLEEKQRKHAQYLGFLDVVGCMPALAAPTLGGVLEDGERLAACGALREVWNRRSDRGREGGGGGGGGGDGAGAKVLLKLAELAGQQLSERESGLAGRPRWEVFYSRASAVSKFFEVAASEGAALARAEGEPAMQYAAAGAVCEALLAMAARAEDARERQRDLYPQQSARAAAAAGHAPWLAGPEARAAFRTAVLLCSGLRQVLRAGAPARLEELHQRLGEVTVRCLQLYRTAVEALPPGSDSRRTLYRDYAAVRGEALAALLAWGEEVRSYDQVMFVAQLAEQHDAFEELAQVCELVDNAEERRCDLMRRLPGSAADGIPSFATFMYERWRAGGQHHQLLSLRDEFSASLLEYLGAHPSLRWMHELRMERYGDAGGTLLGLSAEATRTRADRSRLLCLGKLAAMADASPTAGAARGGGGAGTAHDTALRLLDVERALKPREDDAAAPPTPPPQLVDLCLKAPSAAESGERAVLAFSVFAMAGADFRRQNRAKLEACWRRVAEATDWDAVAGGRAGNSDEDYLTQLRGTPLHGAAERCYGPGATCVGGRFSEAMPVEEVKALLEGGGAVNGGEGAVSAALDALYLPQQAAGKFGAGGAGQDMDMQE